MRKLTLHCFWGISYFFLSTDLMEILLHESVTTCHLVHPTGNILIISQIRFSTVFSITVNIQTKVIKSMTRSETYLLGACVEFSFPFGLITSINLLLLVSLRLPSPFAVLKITVDSGIFKALSKSIAMPNFAEYHNKAPIIFLFTCKVID